MSPPAFLLAVAAGTFAAALILPAWLPGLSASLQGPEPKAYWYLSRVSGIVAFVLVWLAMGLGLSMTNMLARVWPGGPTVFDLHQHTSLLGLAFALFHGLVLVGDRRYTLGQVLIPFASAEYRPFWVGVGQVSLYLMAVVALTFYVRRSLGHRWWRLIHFGSFAVYLGVLTHGVASGTDTATTWMQAIYLSSGVSLLFLTIYRVLVLRSAQPTKRPVPRPAR